MYCLCLSTKAWNPNRCKRFRFLKTVSKYYASNLHPKAFYQISILDIKSEIKIFFIESKSECKFSISNPKLIDIDIEFKSTILYISIAVDMGRICIYGIAYQL